VDRLILTAPAFRQFERLRSLEQPVLMAWAEDDEVIPVRYMAEYEARVPDLTVVRYEYGGHSAAPKNAADFAPRAISFLRS
jgi:pimeloyl-ACP methyl ester carboxylesterase